MNHFGAELQNSAFVSQYERVPLSAQKLSSVSRSSGTEISFQPELLLDGSATVNVLNKCLHKWSLIVLEPELLLDGFVTKQVYA